VSSGELLNQYHSIFTSKESTKSKKKEKLTKRNFKWKNTTAFVITNKKRKEKEKIREELARKKRRKTLLKSGAILEKILF
jgi:hypothetical protein